MLRYFIIRQFIGVNDFVDGKHMEIRYEASLRLAALHIRQVCAETTTSKSFNRTNVHHVE